MIRYHLELTGLVDVSKDPAYRGIYEDGQPDPAYDPHRPEEQRLFQQHTDSMLLKLTSYLSSSRQQGNLFTFQSAHSLDSVLRLTEDKLELPTYQRLKQRLARQVQVSEGGID